jgi:hypothetical protein
MAAVARSRRAANLAARARRIALEIGALVGGVALLYFVLWWSAAQPSGETAWSTPTRTALAIAVAAVCSIMLGRAAAVTALAVMARRSGARALVALQPARSRVADLAVLGLAFGAAAALLSVTAAPAAAPAPPPFAVRPTGLRVIVIGIDGFEPALHDRLAASGRAPRLASLLGPASAIATTRIGPDRDPARVWTSMATGRLAQAHGIYAIEARRVSGLRGALPAADSRAGEVLAAVTDLLRLTRPTIASGVERREKTFWEIGAEKGLRTAVVNWWATWPADSRAGIVASDRAVLRLERGGELDAELAPPSIYEPLRAAWPSIRTDVAGRAAGAFANGAEPDAVAVLRRSAELDAANVAIARRPDLGLGDLLAVYLPGLDIVQQDLFGEGTPQSAAALTARVDAVERYYEFLDRLIDDLLREFADERPLVAVLTSPGRIDAPTPGLLAFSGDAAASGARATAAPVDAAPTILHLIGLPISEELDGVVRSELLSADFLVRHPVRTTPTYGRRGASTAVRGPAPLDNEMLERLRSLGYVR